MTWELLTNRRLTQCNGMRNVLFNSAAIQPVGEGKQLAAAFWAREQVSVLNGVWLVRKTFALNDLRKHRPQSRQARNGRALAAPLVPPKPGEGGSVSEGGRLRRAVTLVPPGRKYFLGKPPRHAGRQQESPVMPDLFLPPA